MLQGVFVSFKKDSLRCSESSTIFRNGNGVFACPYCDGAYYQTPDTLKRHVKDSHDKEETEADSDDDSMVQDDCLDVTLKANRSIPVSAAPTVPNKEDDVRHDHHTAVLSAFDAMGESEKEQGKKLLVAELGDLDPIAIVDQEGKEYNLLANKKIINTIIELNQTPLVFSLSKKRKFVDEEDSQPDPPSTSIRNIILDSYCKNLLSKSHYLELDEKTASWLNWSWTLCPIMPKIAATLLEEAILVDRGKSLLILGGEIYSRIPSKTPLPIRKIVDDSID